MDKLSFRFSNCCTDGCLLVQLLAEEFLAETEVGNLIASAETLEVRQKGT